MPAYFRKSAGRLVENGRGILAGTPPVHLYRPDIDGLRGVAVLLVLLFHAGCASVRGGFAGVDIFFVISGYLITGIVVREQEAGHFSFANFYARRIKRICPALFAVLACSIIAGFLLLIPGDLRSFGRSAVSAVLFYSNWHFYTQVGYFDGPAIEKPLLHTWSLAIEEQFYLLWPIALSALYLTFGRRVLPKVTLVLLCLSLATAEITLRQDQPQAFYLLPCRAWELLLGAYLALAPFPQFGRFAGSLLGIAGLSAIAYAALAFDTNTPFPGLNTAFPCFGAAFLIAAGTDQTALSSRLLSFYPVRVTGRISYSLYLIHWPLFSFAHLALDRAPTAGERTFIVFASLLLAAVCYLFVEQPARRARFGFAGVAKAAAFAAIPLVACGILYHATNGLPGRLPQSAQIAYAAKQPGHKARDAADCRSEARPPLLGRPCAIGAQARNGQYDFIIWGDSHARHLASAFSAQAAARGLAGLVATVEGCPPFLHEGWLTPKCKEANAKVEQWVKTQLHLKAIFLAAWWSAYTKEGLLNVSKGQTHAADPAKRLGLADTIDLLRTLNLQIFFIEDVPTFPVDIPQCASRALMFGWDVGRCLIFGRGEIEAKAEPASSLLRQASRAEGIPIVETFGAFCGPAICRPETDGVIFYSDNNHLNTEGARHLGRWLNIPWIMQVASRQPG
ncbi:MAG: acyltransferase family protein [Rhodomicrobium sp.]